MKKRILIDFVLIVICLGCSGQNTSIIVRFDVEKPSLIDFSPYQKILFSDFKINLPTDKYHPAQDIKNFFINDFGKAIRREVGYWPSALNYYNTDTDFISELSKNPNALVITGKIDIDIKKRSMIQDNKDKKVKIKKKFVQIENWEMKGEIVLLDSASGKVVLKKEYTKKSTDAEPEKERFNFEKLFFQITDSFIQDISPRTKLQKRYILSK